jgi:threonine dehydratase
MWPVTLQDVLNARERIRGTLAPTPFRSYPPLDEHVGYGIRVFVKHENHQPTQAFKARNALAALSALGEGERKRGVVAATRGNHGQAGVGRADPGVPSSSACRAATTTEERGDAGDSAPS